MTSGAGAAVTSAVLVSACIHAVWNALAHRLPDKGVSFSWIGLSYVIIGLPVALVLRTPAGPSWPWLVASAALHGAYNLLLMRSYRLGEFNQVYPLARGTSPLVVAVAAVFVVHEDLTPARTLGVLVVSVGLASLAFVGGAPRISGTRGRAAVVASVGTGLAIAAYTVVDGVGVRHSGSPFGYTAWLMALQGPMIPLWTLSRRRGEFWPTVRPYWRAGMSAGALSMVAYGLVLWAQTRGALAAVAALRESGVVVGAAIGSLVFHERFGRRRVVATVLVVLGIALLDVT